MMYPVIDIEKTSARLKSLREQHGIKISQLQALFNMANPQSIYNWENPGLKTLPRIDNMVVLAKLYGVRIDDMIVIRELVSDCLQISEGQAPFELEKDFIDFIQASASERVLDALENFYNFSFQKLS